MIKCRPVNIALMALLAVSASLMVRQPAAAKEERASLETFRARAFNVDWGGATNLDIVIYEWTTPEERQSLAAAFRAQGGDGLYDALTETSAKAFLRMPRTPGYAMKYAWEAEVDGRRRIVLAVDRPIGFLALSRDAQSAEDNVTLVMLNVDAATGRGEGTVIGGAELSVDDETGQLSIEIDGQRATKLTKVRPLRKGR